MKSLLGPSSSSPSADRVPSLAIFVRSFTPHRDPKGQLPYSFCSIDERLRKTFCEWPKVPQTVSTGAGLQSSYFLPLPHTTTLLRKRKVSIIFKKTNKVGWS